MAGLLESFANWAEPLRSASYYTRRAENQKEQEKQAQMAGLLAQYQGSQAVAAPPGMGATSAPQTGPQGLLGGQGGGAGYLPPQFYQQAGILPGNEQYLLQDQTGGQQMARQQQDQLWNRDNMTKYQTSALAQDQSQWAGVSGNQAAALAQQAAEYQRQFGGLSAYQQAVLKNDELRIKNEEAQIKATGPGVIKPPSGYMPNAEGTTLIPIPGSADDERQVLGLAALETGIKAAQEGIDAIEKYGSFESGKEAKQRDAYVTNTLVNAQAQLKNSGVLNPTEAEAYAANIPQQNALGSLFTRDDTAQAKLEALKRQLEDKRQAMYKAQGRKPPPIPKLPGT